MDKPQALLRIPRRGLGAALLVALLNASCGSPKGDISGTVTYKGTPVPSGSVTFLDAKHQAVGSSPIMAGRYSVGRVSPGLVKITVKTPPVPTGAMPGAPPGFSKEPPKEEDIEPSKGKQDQQDNKDEEGKQGKKTEGKRDQKEKEDKASAGLEAPAQPPTHVSVPTKYADPDSSGLSYKVQPGVQVHNIELE